MNIFEKNIEKFSFLFKSFVKIEFSYVFTITCSAQLKTAWKSELSYKNRCFFYLVCNYLRPSNNSRQLIFNIKAVVFIAIIC